MGYRRRMGAINSKGNPNDDDDEIYGESHTLTWEPNFAATERVVLFLCLYVFRYCFGQGIQVMRAVSVIGIEVNTYICIPCRFCCCSCCY